MNIHEYQAKELLARYASRCSLVAWPTPRRKRKKERACCVVVAIGPDQFEPRNAPADLVERPTGSLRSWIAAESMGI